MKYYLKEYYDIFNLDNIYITIGIPNAIDFIKIEFSKNNIKLIDSIIYDGITLSQINNCEIYKELYKKGMLRCKSEEDVVCDNFRRNLFLEYSCNNVILDYDFLNDRIMILGAGAIGGSMAFLLAQFGYKNLIIIDDDHVEKSDCEKTFVYRKNDIGKNKVNAISDILNKEFGIIVESKKMVPTTKDEIIELIDIYKPSFIIKACDPELNFRFFLNEACFERRIPHIHTAYSYENLVIGPLYIPTKTCCDNSFKEANRRYKGNLWDFNKVKKLYTNKLIHPSISFNINTVSNIALKEIIYFHLNKLEYCCSIGKIFYFNLIKNEAIAYEAECMSNCQFKNLRTNEPIN